jgi:glycosyltransferase involved in cell wall biosynthesis
MPSMPLVSIILPVYNAARYVCQALDSVYAQTYSDYEIVMVHGASTDNTDEVVREASRVRHVAQTGRGLADAWNAGLAAAVGELICFLDSDDLWPDYKLERQEGYLDQHPPVEYVIGQVTFFLEPGCTAPAALRPEIFAGPHIGYMPGTLMARRRLFDRLGDFGTEWTITPDIEWFARAQADRVTFAALPDVLLNKRVHDDNLSTVMGPSLIRRELLRLMKRTLDRRRQNTAQPPAPEPD